MRSRSIGRALSLRLTFVLATLALALVSLVVCGVFLVATADLRTADAEAARPVASATDASLGELAARAAGTKTALARASQWHDRAKLCAAFVTAALVVLGVALLRWLRTGGLEPLDSLSDAMRRFTTGDREARASARGCAELRTVATRFNEMAAELAKERTAQMTFLASVAHDLKNPLSTVKLCLRLGANPELAPDMNERAERQLARMDRMIGDLLDVCSIEAGRLEVNFQREDLREVVRRALEAFDAIAPARVDVAFCDEPAEVSCDALRLEQVVTNLVSNALKYSPADTPVAVSVEHDRSDAILHVADRGVGIAPDDQKRLFQPFRRVGRSTGSVAGFGLGLSVVRRIVLAHGGQVDVESEAGRGSTFTVRLPLA